jgi:hypothetical protein
MNAKRRSRLFICAILATASVVQVPGVSAEPRSVAAQSDVTTTDLKNAYGRLPLSFEANRGQTDARVEFFSRGPGYNLFLTRSGEAVLALRKSAPRHDPRHSPDSAGKVRLQTQGVGSQAVLRMKLVSANKTPRVESAEELPGKANYFIGNDPKNWRTNIPTYARVKYHAVYSGVDLVYYGNQQQLEYDFVVAPGADPTSITIGFEGAEKLSLDDDGDLVLTPRDGEVRFQKPVVYQEIDGVRRKVSGRYTLKGAHQIGFQVAAYDGSRPLIIDPTLIYSTYLGGSNFDSGGGIAVDASGNAYVTGDTQSNNFPTIAGAFDMVFAGPSDAFVAKLDPAGSALIYSTYLGGSNVDLGAGIALDASFNAYVAGYTASTNFPTTAGAFDTTLDGSFDGFVAKLNSTGSALVYSTYLGGADHDFSFGIALDASLNAYATGRTYSTDFPTTAGAFQTSNAGGGGSDAFLAKLNSTGSALVSSTYLGGSSDDLGSDIAVDVSLNAYVTGNTTSTNFPTTAGAFQTTNAGSNDAFVTKVDPTGSSLVYSTYLGGSQIDEGMGIAVDASFNAYVTGDTHSPNYPTTAGAFDTTHAGSSDGFVTKLNPTGSAPLVYSTYLGGFGLDSGSGIAVDTSFNAYVAGNTESIDFPTTAGAFQTANAGLFDAFVMKLNPTGSALVYSTYLGGSSDDFSADIAVDASFNAYATGTTGSANFPTTPGAFDTTHNGFRDAYVVKIPDIGTPATLTLSPPAASNPVGTQHCVTANVEDASGDPSSGTTVRFSVTGSVTASGSATTDANGNATFCYTGPDLPGEDAITAFADANNDGSQDTGEPGGAATKSWVLPETTPLCEVKITQGGWIVAANGDRASFGGNASSSEEGATQGQEQYQDHGPVQRINVHSINVLAIVCDGSTEASIYGQATIDGGGSFFYRIKVKDLSKPGRGIDTYWILLANGYNSGEQALRGGNVQIRRD